METSLHALMEDGDYLRARAPVACCEFQVSAHVDAGAEYCFKVSTLI